MKSLDYWIERGKRREVAADRECRWVASEIGSLYQAALRSIQSRIKKLYRRYTEGYGLTPEQADALLTAQQTRDARQELEDLLEQCTDPSLAQEIRAKLDAPAYAYRISRLEALRDQVYFDAKSVGMAETAIGETALVDVYKDSYYRTAFDQSQELGENVPFEHLDDHRAAEAVQEYYATTPEQQAQNYSNRVWRDTEYLAEQVREIVTEGLMTGGNYQEMAERLDAAVGTVSAQKHIQPDGTTRTVLSGRGATYRATRLIRTEGNRLSGQATLKSFRDAGIERYIYRALLEVRTCKVCGELDGKDFAVSDATVGKNMHPMHPNCRCYIGPYHDKEWLDRHKRNAQGMGQVPQSMTFQEWKKKFVKKQKEAEAKAKAESETEQIAIDGWITTRRKHKTAPKTSQQASVPAEAPLVEIAPPAVEQGSFTAETIAPATEVKKIPEVSVEKVAIMPESGIIGFKTEALFERHYEKHKAAFGDISKDEYIQRANSLAQRPLSTEVETLTRSDGSVSKYDAGTNEFLVLNEDGTIRTYFIPDQGKAYWEEEHERNK